MHRFQEVHLSRGLALQRLPRRIYSQEIPNTIILYEVISSSWIYYLILTEHSTGGILSPQRVCSNKAMMPLEWLHHFITILWLDFEFIWEVLKTAGIAKTRCLRSASHMGVQFASLEFSGHSETTFYKVFIYMYIATKPLALWGRFC